MEFKGNVEEFAKEVEKGKTLVDFYATWCGPCRMLGPVIEEVDKERDDLKVITVNVDENLELAQKYGVMGVPHLLVFKNGDPVAESSGFRPKEILLNWIDEN